MKNKRYFIINRNCPGIKRMFPDFKYYVLKNEGAFEVTKRGRSSVPAAINKDWLFCDEAEEISEKEIALMF